METVVLRRWERLLWQLLMIQFPCQGYEGNTIATATSYFSTCRYISKRRGDRVDFS